jgi:hypothetical protein
MKNHKTVADAYIADMHHIQEGSVNACLEKPRTRKVRYLALNLELHPCSSPFPWLEVSGAALIE